MSMLWRLWPNSKDKGNKTIIILDAGFNDYPVALVNMDIFYEGCDPKIHDLLMDGETVTVEAEFRLVPEGS